MKLKSAVSGLKYAAKGFLAAPHPFLAHLIVTRRCNLSCGYCNEYDDFSKPVPTEALKERVRHLARLKTVFVTLTGGEPLLHPDLEEIIDEVTRQGMTPTLISNGFLMTKERIEKLNGTGLANLQISIDNLKPDDVSMKSLKTLDGKLKLLAEHATFHVNINSVLGISDERTVDAFEVARRALELGFTHSVGILHDENGTQKPMTPKQIDTYKRISRMSKNPVNLFNYLLFQRKLVRGQEVDWKCRCGARYLYICEDGLVHWCSQQRGYPGTPLSEYGVEDLKREFDTTKGCAPTCTITCTHQASVFDEWRPRQRLPDPYGGGSHSQARPTR